MTIRDILRNDTYPQKALLEKLVCHYCGLTKSALYTQSDRTISDAEATNISTAYERYTKHKEPLEYILWYVEFAQLRFAVTPATLIPRPETEYMIEAVRERCQTQPQQSTTLRDIGTGCGVLWLSTLYYEHPTFTQAILTDLSTDALAVAKKNFAALFPDAKPSLPVEFFESNLLDMPLLAASFHKANSLLLVANLPYIPDQLFDENVDDGVKKREPKMAFVGGDDGLDLYRIMLRQMIALHQSQQKQVTCFLEMMTRQGEILQKEFAETFAFEEVKTFHFNIRIVKGVMR